MRLKLLITRERVKEMRRGTRARMTEAEPRPMTYITRVGGAQGLFTTSVLIGTGSGQDELLQELHYCLGGGLMHQDPVMIRVDLHHSGLGNRGNEAIPVHRAHHQPGPV